MNRLYQIKKPFLTGSAIIMMTALLAVCALAWAGEPPKSVTVFAAASTTDVVTEISRLFENENLGTVVTSFAASSTLAKQIENKAPADIFISANQEWMNYLETKQCILSATRFDLLGNRLVLIAQMKSPITKVDLARECDLAGLLDHGRLAMGDPDHVPAGMYGKAALISLGIWPQVEDAVAAVASVRAAMVLVERQESPLGIVYATDAAVSKNIKIVGTFPKESHGPITYPVAMVAGCKSTSASRFITFLKSAQARKVFEKAGFTVLE